MRKTNQINMLEGSLLPKILLFTIPLMLSSILQLLFNAADVIVVGKFAGKECLAAVSSTSSLINLITNLFIGLSIGVNVIVARHIGERQNEKIFASVTTSILLAIIGGIFIGIVGFFVAKPMLHIMGSPDEVINLSTTYLKIIFIGMPALTLYNYGAAILRAQGDTKRPLNFLTIAGVVNLVLNLFFVIVLKIDVAGVALATIISQYISAYLIMKCLMAEQWPFGFGLKDLHFDKDEFKEILIVGFPAGLQGTVFSLSNVTIQASINSFGSEVMAGNGASCNIEGFVYVGMNAFHQAAVSFTSQNIGAKKLDRINRILLSCLLCVIVSGLILGFGAIYFADSLVSLYNSDPMVISAGIKRLNLICSTYFVCGIMDVICGSIRGLGNSFVPMVTSLIGACAFRLIWIATAFQKIRTVEILYMSYPASWIITAAFHLLFYIIIKRKTFKKINESKKSS